MSADSLQDGASPFTAAAAWAKQLLREIIALEQRYDLSVVFMTAISTIRMTECSEIIVQPKQQSLSKLLVIFGAIVWNEVSIGTPFRRSSEPRPVRPKTEILLRKRKHRVCRYNEILYPSNIYEPIIIYY
uniref:Uncharacterized protein n=1 Tax=Acrobeloides nanus TaxID=290746 RepID=A0A914EJ39_9BILA